MATGDGDGARGWDIFVSYTSADRAWAEWVAWQLEDAGYHVLVQAWDFVPGSNFASEMQQGIEHARWMIALLSHAYLKSQYASREWQAAAMADPVEFPRKLIPIRIEDCPRPGLLHTVVSLDLFDLPSDAAHRHLLNGVRAAIDGRIKPKVPPLFPVPFRQAPPIAEPDFPAVARRRTAGRSVGEPLTGHTHAVTSVAFAPNGHILASASHDRTVRLWDVSNPNSPQPLGRPLTGHVNLVVSVAFAPDGHTLASASWDKTVRLWDVSDPNSPEPLSRPLTGHTDWVVSVAFAPNGHTLASASHDTTVRLWDVSNPNSPEPLGRPLTHHTNRLLSSWLGKAVVSVAFAPDGCTFASASHDTTVRLWDVSNPNSPQPLGPPLTQYANRILSAWLGTLVVSVAVAPDGHTLATASHNSVRLWDVSDPNSPEPLGPPLTGHTDLMASVAFAPNGHTLATAGWDNTVWLWDVSNRNSPQPLGPPLTGHTGPVMSVTFAPDGHTLATASHDGTVRLWRPY